jgi:hypothetical protein
MEKWFYTCFVKNDMIKLENKIVFKADAKHTAILIKAGHNTAANAIRVSKALGLPITYIEAGVIIQEMPDGIKNVISVANNTKNAPAFSFLKKGMVLYKKHFRTL